MGAITSYECDGDGCKELTEKPKGCQYPPLEVWPRVTVKIGANEVVGSVHNAACAISFVDKTFAEVEQLESHLEDAGPGEPREVE